METLQTIETKIDKLIEQNKKDIEMTEAELVKASQAISDAQAKLVQAQKEINSEKYVEAKSDLWTAERTKEFHEGRLKELSENPMITYDEYHVMVAEVYKLADEQQKTFYVPARKKVMEIIKLGDDSLKETKHVDSILKKLEKDISKNNEEYKKDKNGSWLSGFYSGLSYEPRDALYGYRHKLNNIAENFKRE
ncbi:MULTISPECIES: hypothetical protein [Streptococcus]|uniref:Prophage ps3 protein 07 n=1 Tax=Streptococcus pseudopneumoniae TaxID=257758 RepID=A0A0T8UC10_9STRE|nr:MULTISPECIES: hypothetical protein [Streptococcus]RJP07712.1 hypothetical protein C5O71_08140 [Streptococcus pseudopneumoniae]CKB07496.1 Prophage ps3 protein 07 [Streptococcus pseudopneumoniae]